MIALAINNYIWGNLSKDTQFNSQYDKYRLTLGPNFIPFFPVADNLAGDISWGSEPYILYDSIHVRPSRSVYGERQEQVMYTLVGQIPELFDFKEKIVSMFDHWEATQFSLSGYRINDIDIWQPDKTRGRDKLRQTYSLPLLLDVFYIPC